MLGHLGGPHYFFPELKLIPKLLGVLTDALQLFLDIPVKTPCNLCTPLECFLVSIIEIVCVMLWHENKVEPSDLCCMLMPFASIMMTVWDVID